MYKCFNFMKKESKIDNLKNAIKKETEKKLVGMVLVSLLVFFAILFSVFAFIYLQSPERELKLGANIENITLSEDGHNVYIRLNAGSTDKNITKVKFIFTDRGGEECIFRTTEGIYNISISYNQSFFDWLFGISQFEGVYDYDISLNDLECLSDFKNIVEVSVIFEYEDNGTLIDTLPLDTEKLPTDKKNGGGGGGGNGDSPPTPCVSDCAGKVCGNDGCGGSCGVCVVLDYCNGGVCTERERIIGFRGTFHQRL